MFATASSEEMWCISPGFSAARALAITAVLRVLGLIEGCFVLLLCIIFIDCSLELSDDCNTVVTFYATSLPQVVGNLYQAPSLAFLAWHWFKSSSKYLVANLPGFLLSFNTS